MSTTKDFIDNMRNSQIQKEQQPSSQVAPVNDTTMEDIRDALQIQEDE